MGKEKLRRDGTLPASISCDPNLIITGHELLLEAQQNSVQSNASVNNVVIANI
jgi:hypothetical protein